MTLAHGPERTATSLARSSVTDKLFPRTCGLDTMMTETKTYAEPPREQATGKLMTALGGRGV